jgi:hypothetical protein
LVKGVLEQFRRGGLCLCNMQMILSFSLIVSLFILGI